ncbi:MAG TPA: hypothetical protein VMT46_14580 [Anaerolineaceae bacterium]|nr:hypothetical protein [Anaerolineaceae bacterium]
MASWSYVDIFRVERRQIRERWGMVDRYSLLRQLGAVTAWLSLGRYNRGS